MKERKTLKKYKNSEVVVTGIYIGYPDKHEKPVEKSVSSHGCLEDEKNNSQVLFKRMEPNVDYQKLLFVRNDFASCIKNVRGLYQFNDINEDHINIQFNMSGNCIKKGDEIKITGQVYSYTKNYKGKAFDDYGIKVWNYELMNN